MAKKKIVKPVDETVDPVCGCSIHADPCPHWADRIAEDGYAPETSKP